MIDCGCPLPVEKTFGNVFLGRTLKVRLCCIAAHLEECGIVVATLEESDPKEVWVRSERGDPPAWLENRLAERGIDVRD